MVSLEEEAVVMSQNISSEFANKDLLDVRWIQIRRNWHLPAEFVRCLAVAACLACARAHSIDLIVSSDKCQMVRSAKYLDRADSCCRRNTAMANERLKLFPVLLIKIIDLWLHVSCPCDILGLDRVLDLESFSGFNDKRRGTSSHTLRINHN